jgi:hypothetical protein
MASLGYSEHRSNSREPAPPMSEAPRLTSKIMGFSLTTLFASMLVMTAICSSGLLHGF